jgi:predicted ATPase/class 3 adenylate cyclase
MAAVTGSEVGGGALTFFFSDIEGSTQLAAALGERFAEVLGEHRAIVRTAFGAHRGTEVSTSGDSFFAVFASPVDALLAAAAVQRDLAPPLAGGTRVRVRIGLHTGHAVRVGDDYLGLDVHRAARIADAGHGGQVLVSESTRGGSVDPLPEGLVLRDLGRHRLKDIGPERLWQLAGPGLPAGPFPVPRSLEAHPTNLPADVSPFVDREADRQAVTALVRTAPVVTVLGAGGIGKTRLAIEVARSLVEAFPDGVFQLDLAAIQDADVAAASLAEVMGLPPIADQPPLVGLLDRLRNRELLLVLDTADRVADLPGLVANIAAACPRIRVLVTSRSPLHVAAEREYVLAPLEATAAIELFAARAAAVRPGFSLDSATRTTVARLVGRLDGIPLAIELAAARARLLAPAALLDRLERRLPAFGGGARDLPARQRTLRDTIAWSYELLGPAEQSLFAKLGVFAGSFDLAALEAVASLPEESDALALVEQLVDRSLVVSEPSDDEPRFRLLAPIREFAAEMLEARDDVEAVRERHAQHWVAFVRERAPALVGSEDLAAVAALRSRETEIRAALDWLLAPLPEAPAGERETVARERAALALDMSGLLGRYWWIRGRVHEGSGWLERALAVASDAGAHDRARALYWAGVMLDDIRQPGEARERLESALTLFEQLDDQTAAARVLNSLGVVARSLGDASGAEALLEASIEQKRRLGDQAGIAVSLSNLGVVAGDRGDHARAAELFADALAIDESLGAVGNVALARANLGETLVRAGRLEDGLAQIRRALPGIAELEDPDEVATLLVSLAHARLDNAGPVSAEDVARLILASEALRERERIPLRTMDRAEVDDLLRRTSDLLEPGSLDEIRVEVSAIDLPAAIALAGSAAAMDEGTSGAQKYDGGRAATEEASGR